MDGINILADCQVNNQTLTGGYQILRRILDLPLKVG